MPVRNPRHLGHNIIGSFPSIKLQRNVLFESTIECDYCYELDFSLDVLKYEEQPFTIDYQVDGKKRRYTPDFSVIESNKIIVVECKPAALITNEENQRRFEVGREWCNERGYEYRIVTDENLRNGSRLENIKTIWRFGRHSVSADVKAKIFAMLYDAQEPLTVEQLASQLYMDDIKMGMRALYHLAFFHQVAIPLEDSSIGLDSFVVLPSQLDAVTTARKLATT